MKQENHKNMKIRRNNRVKFQFYFIFGFLECGHPIKNRKTKKNNEVVAA